MAPSSANPYLAAQAAVTNPLPPSSRQRIPSATAIRSREAEKAAEPTKKKKKKETTPRQPLPPAQTRSIEECDSVGSKHGISRDDPDWDDEDGSSSHLDDGLDAPAPITQTETFRSSVIPSKPAIKAQVGRIPPRTPTPAEPEPSKKRIAPSSCDSEPEPEPEQKRHRDCFIEEDLSQSEHLIWNKAFPLFRCLIATVEAFPQPLQVQNFSKWAWKEAINKNGLILVPLSPAVAKLFESRVPTIRGAIKTKARSIVEAHPGFQTGNNERIRDANRDVYEKILKAGNGFMYKEMNRDAKKRKGIYLSPLIQKTINTVWFKNKKGDGVIYPDFFSPLSLPTLALVLTVIENCVDKWKDGTRTDIHFKTTEYSSVYNRHLKLAKDFEEKTAKHDIMGKTVKILHETAWFHSGAAPLHSEEVVTMPQDVCDAAMREWEESATESESQDELGIDIGASSSRAAKAAALALSDE